jgi:hypothetical protein
VREVRAERIRGHLTYANVGVTICLFVLLGGSAYAAAHLKRNTVKSKQIKDGQVETQDLADGAVTGAKVADDSLQGADIDESTLATVDAARTGGMEIKKINLQVPGGTAAQTVLEYPGIFKITASCGITGDILDISASTGKPDSTISRTAVIGAGADDHNGVQDLVSKDDADFDPGEALELDSTAQFGTIQENETVNFATPDGFVATTSLHMDVGPDANICQLTGVSIGG